MNGLSLEADDLIARLRSGDGPAVRQALLVQLDELERRVSTALRAGLPRGDYPPLEAALLAVRAGRDTLQRLNLQSTAASGGSALRGFEGHPPGGSTSE